MYNSHHYSWNRQDWNDSHTQCHCCIIWVSRAKRPPFASNQREYEESLLGLSSPNHPQKQQSNPCPSCRRWRRGERTRRYITRGSHRGWRAQITIKNLEAEHLVDDTNTAMAGGLGENDVRGFIRVSTSSFVPATSVWRRYDLYHGERGDIDLSYCIWGEEELELTDTSSSLTPPLLASTRVLPHSLPVSFSVVTSSYTICWTCGSIRWLPRTMAPHFLNIRDGVPTACYCCLERGWLSIASCMSGVSAGYSDAPSSFFCSSGNKSMMSRG